MKINAVAFCLLMIACTNGEQRSVPKPEAGTDWALLPFKKADAANPVLAADSSLVFTDPIWKKEVRWAEKDVFNPAAVIRNDTLFLLFRAEDKIGKHAGVSRIGLAWSLDGTSFTALPQPVLYPQEDAFKKWEWEGGIEDPRVTQKEDGTYIMTYTSYDGKTARLMVAASPDLRHWTKHGPAFQKAHDGSYVDKWSKSGSIVSDYSTGTPVAKKIKDKYWMYYGDVNIWAATSDDGIHWQPLLYAEGESRETKLRHNAPEMAAVKTVLAPREGLFDSDLVEPGPPALYTDNGIVLLYNGRNVPSIGDTSLAEGTYSGGQALMNKENPTEVLDRRKDYFITPDKPYEITGQVNHVCFIEGLVQYKGKWFLYYGTADSKIAVAIKD